MRALLLGFGAAVMALGASVSASAGAPMYKATPVASPIDGKIVVHDIAWKCASGNCFAARTGSSTDATMCAAVARDLGRLAAFGVGDATFDETALEKCNRRAR